MIISKPLATGDVVTLKLTNGEEIIGRYAGSTAEGYILNKVVGCGIQRTEQGAQIVFIPFAATTEEGEKFVFPVTSVIFRPMRTRDDVAKTYISATSSLVAAG